MLSEFKAKKAMESCPNWSTAGIIYNDDNEYQANLTNITCPRYENGVMLHHQNAENWPYRKIAASIAMQLGCAGCQFKNDRYESVKVIGVNENGELLEGNKFIAIEKNDY